MAMPVALTIAGSDPSGGAGIQADLKTFHQFGVYGEAAVTLITVQNSQGVERVEYLAADLVAAQVRAVVEDIPPAAAKTGALGTREVIEAVAEIAAEFRFPLVIDPVLFSKNGTALLAPDALEAFQTRLLCQAFLLTPNLQEAATLSGLAVCDASGMRRAAEKLAFMGARSVLVKGGHLAGDAVDVLFSDGQWLEFPAPRIATRHTHGTGCTFSAAITASLAAGNDLRASVAKAKQYISDAIRNSPELGRGAGPVNHHAGSAKK